MTTWYNSPGQGDMEDPSRILRAHKKRGRDMMGGRGVGVSSSGRRYMSSIYSLVCHF
jgi:hypothetical protein